MDGNGANGRAHRADWKGERVLLTGRVRPEVRERLLALAERRGMSMGALLEEFAESAGAAAPAPAVPEVALPGGGPYGAILADPPWRFTNRTGKVAPEHRRLSRYDTMPAAQIAALPVADVAAPQSHLYLWVPNALLAEGLAVMRGWGFQYKGNLVWHKVRKDGGSDGRGVGFYFRNVTELVLFGVRGSLRTLPPGRRQVNLLATRKREHSRKPEELYPVIEACSPGPYLELFARYPREGWASWGAEADAAITPRGRQWPAYR
jgi:N6-adenosine-specific RNA methylase IME4